MNEAPAAESSLRREVGLGLFVFYGVGNIVGAGVYVLIGKVAGEAGYAAPVAFITAAIIAGLTGRSYGELAARFPRSAGEAVYLYEAFRVPSLSVLVGLLIALAGLVSAATITRGFIGYFNVFFSTPDPLVMIVLLGLLTLIAVRGILASAWVNAVFTIIQVGGLLWIIIAAAPVWVRPEALIWQELLPTSGMTWLMVINGAFLAFYAFIGFEDMVNIAEEVRQPAVTIPRGIMISFAISTVLYTLLAVASVATIDPVTLAASEKPLADVCAQAAWCTPGLISLIGLTVINGALIQIIMASRIFYGMAGSGWLPAFLATVNRSTRTPLVATVIAGAIALVLAFFLPLISLAKITSGMVLTVFILVNLSLIVVKRRSPAPPGVRPVALLVPVTGLVGSVIILLVAL